MMNKAIVIGRHNGEIPGFEIIEKRSITFPATSEECKPIFECLLSDAFAAGAALIFQALPGQMVAAICSSIGHGGPITHVPVGVVVSKPGERPAGKQYTFDSELFLAGAEYEETDVYHGEVERLAKHCNPNARVDGFTPKQDNSPLAGALVHPARIGRTAQVIRAVLAWQDGQQEPLADLVEDLMQADEARRLLAQRGYGRESQALPELAEATPALWW